MNKDNKNIVLNKLIEVNNLLNDSYILLDFYNGRYTLVLFNAGKKEELTHNATAAAAAASLDSIIIFLKYLYSYIDNLSDDLTAADYKQYLKIREQTKAAAGGQRVNIKQLLRGGSDNE